MQTGKIEIEFDAATGKIINIGAPLNNLPQKLFVEGILGRALLALQASPDPQPKDGIELARQMPDVPPALDKRINGRPLGR
jgi:hypothetical protein